MRSTRANSSTDHDPASPRAEVTPTSDFEMVDPDPPTVADGLFCSDCEEIKPLNNFTSNQQKKGEGRRCAQCVRNERQRAENPESSSSSHDDAPHVPLPLQKTWGVATVAAERAPQVGDKFELWLPKGTKAYERKEWVGRIMNTETVLPERIQLTAPYYATRECEKGGTWISVHVTAQGNLQAMGVVQKPPLNTSDLPAHLRGPPPSAGAARSKDTYASAVTHRAGAPVDRKIAITAYAPKKSKHVYIEEVDGRGSVQLVKVCNNCWRTPAPLPRNSGWTYVVVVETERFDSVPLLGSIPLLGSSKSRSERQRVGAGRYPDPAVLEHVNFSMGIDQEPDYLRAGTMMMSLVEAAGSVQRAGSEPLGSELQTVVTRVVEALVQAAHADFSLGINMLLDGVRRAAAVRRAARRCLPSRTTLIFLLPRPHRAFSFPVSRVSQAP